MGQTPEEEKLELIKIKKKIRVSNIWKWTGISEKKGWDLVQLLISILIPISILWGTLDFNKKQQEIATDRYQQEALTKYFEQISQFLLNKNLREAISKSEAHIFARARTLSTLNQLNDSDENSRNDYKGSLIKFLVEAELINKEKPVIFLKEADLTEADLTEANLENTNLIETKLHLANLSGADLSGANLSGANLSKINFYDPIPTFTIELYRKDRGLSNEQIKSACFWDEAIYTEAKWNQTKEKWILSNEQANQERIEEIRRYETSDPKDTPNCDRWGSRSEL
jgi:hypothetical protein